MSPEATIIMHHCIALLRTLPGVTEEKVQAVATYLGIVVEQAESEEEACPDGFMRRRLLPRSS